MKPQTIFGEVQRVVLLESRTFSTLPPLLQANTTSAMFAMSPSRIYSIYPRLFRKHINVTVNPTSNSRVYAGRIFPLSPFCFAMFTYSNLSGDNVADCTEACRSTTQTTLGLPLIETFHWGGYNGIWDRGICLPLDGPYYNISPSDGFEHLRYIWRLGGTCTNTACPYFNRLEHVY